MRVVHLSMASFTAKRKGGGERYVSELVSAQKALGVDARVMVWPRLTERIQVLSSVHDVAREVSLAEAWAMLRSADLIHVHQLNAPGFDLAAVARLTGGPKIVLTDHGGGAATPGRLLGRLRLRLVAGAAFVSRWSKVDTDPDGVVKAYEVVYGGGNHLPESSGRQFLADFAVVGRLLPHKGAHIAISALPEGKSLIVAGQARDADYMAELERMASGKDVTFVTDLDDSDLSPLYRSIGALLVPSVTKYRDRSYKRPELLGLVALEALASNTPVLGSNVGGLGELLEREGQKVLPDGDVPAWSDALRDFQKDASPVDGSAYSWERVAERCLALYSRVLRVRQGKVLRSRMK